jgi:hypothetical protein
MPKDEATFLTRNSYCNTTLHHSTLHYSRVVLYEIKKERKNGAVICHALLLMFLQCNKLVSSFNFGKFSCQILVGIPIVQYSCGSCVWCVGCGSSPRLSYLTSVVSEGEIIIGEEGQYPILKSFSRLITLMSGVV